MACERHGRVAAVGSCCSCGAQSLEAGVGSSWEWGMQCQVGDWWEGADTCATGCLGPLPGGVMLCCLTGCGQPNGKAQVSCMGVAVSSSQRGAYTARGATTSRHAQAYPSPGHSFLSRYCSITDKHLSLDLRMKASHASTIPLFSLKQDRDMPCCQPAPTSTTQGASVHTVASPLKEPGGHGGSAPTESLPEYLGQQTQPQAHNDEHLPVVQHPLCQQVKQRAEKESTQAASGSKPANTSGALARLVQSY